MKPGLPEGAHQPPPAERQLRKAVQEKDETSARAVETRFEDVGPEARARSPRTWPAPPQVDALDSAALEGHRSGRPGPRSAALPDDTVRESRRSLSDP